MEQEKKRKKKEETWTQFVYTQHVDALTPEHSSYFTPNNNTKADTKAEMKVKCTWKEIEFE